MDSGTGKALTMDRMRQGSLAGYMRRRETQIGTRKKTEGLGRKG